MAGVDDTYLWLEDITGDDALDWVRKHNEPTLAELGGDGFEQMRAEALEVLDTDARIPYVRRRGDYLYNFWRDAANPRGLWRRTTLESYRTEQPEWDVVIDVDALARRRRRELGVGRRRRHRARTARWRWSSCRAAARTPRSCANSTCTRANSSTDGFELPEAKSSIVWEDEDTVLVGTDFGRGSLTDSGYPRIVKRWRRGQPLGDAETVFAGEHDRRQRGGSRTTATPGFERLLSAVHRLLQLARRYELRDDELIRIDVPTDAAISLHREWLLIELRTDWTVGDADVRGRLPAGRQLRGIPLRHRELHVVFEPDEHTSLNHYAWTRDKLVRGDAASTSPSRVRGRHTRHRGRPCRSRASRTNTNTVIVDVDDVRRRDLPRLQRIRQPVAAAVRDGGRRADRDQAARRRSSTPTTSR